MDKHNKPVPSLPEQHPMRADQHTPSGIGPEHRPGAADLVALLQTPACQIEPDGNVRSMNAAWSQLAGPPTTDRWAWAQLIDPEDRDAAIARLFTASMTGEPTAFECRLQENQGSVRWHLLRLQPHRDSPQRAVDWVCIATDIHALKLREAELQLLARTQTEMLNIGMDCIKLIATDGTLIHLNRAGCIALGVPEASPFGMAWLGLLPQEVREAGKAALAEACAGRPARFPGRSALPGQAPQYWDNMLAPMQGANGRTSAILCVSREVTAERVAQESLRQSEERLHLAARVGGLGIWDYDLTSDVLHCDDTWYLIVGRDPAHPIRSVAEFRPIIHPDDVERATEVKMTAAELIATRRDYAIEFRIVRPDGEIRWLRSAACILLDDQGHPARAVGFVVDVTDAKRGEFALRDANQVLAQEKESLARQSLEDPLTGIANRRFLDIELIRVCEQAHREQLAVSIAMIDVDHFKAFNDRYGHSKGDEALRRVAGALQSIARRTDFVTRYGGEEFVIVFPGMDSPEPALLRLAAAMDTLEIAHSGSPLRQAHHELRLRRLPAGLRHHPREAPDLVR